MDPYLSSSEQCLVCQTCGDKGFPNAFVYCVKCLDVAIHRYCLDIIPDTFDELVIWYCEDCQVKSTLTLKKDGANLGHITETEPKTRRGIDSLTTGTREFNCQDYLTEHAKTMPRKKRTKRKKIADSLGAKKIGNMIQQRKKSFVQDCNLLNWLLREWKFLDEPQPSSQSCEHMELVSDSSCERNESDNHEYQAETSSDLSQSVEFENNKQENYYIYGQPVIDPIWRGSFNIIGTRYDHFEGLAAHISTKACYDVFIEVNTLASSLHLEMQPKTVLWPKSLQECEPSDDNIALYFLPGNPTNVEPFNNMVEDMMDNGLAMRAATNNAELLIFSSLLLPPLFRRVQEQYYLWGVFRGKHNGPTSVASHDWSKDSPNEDINVKQTVTMKRMLNAHSPQSHLSNNGVDDVVEPFVEYSDKETGQPVLCDISEHNNDCDMHTEGMEYIHRYCSTVAHKTPRSPLDVLEPPIAEWTHPRLSQHHPLVRRKLYMQKLNRVGPLLILEKSIKRAVFVGPEIFECFTRIGWGGVLNLEDDEVYPEAVTEWMSTLERTGSTVENMKLTGQVNGKKATLDMEFIRETYGVDTGITGHPEAQYEYLTEEALSGKREQNVKQWIKMTSAIFTTTTLDKGTLSENLTPLAKVLWRIGTRNIHPRVGNEHEVFTHEVPIVSSLATGNHAVSYAHLVMMNIWRAYDLKEVTFVPHACLISRFLKLKNALGRNMPPVLTVRENCPFVAGLNLDYMVFKSPPSKAQRNQLSVMC